MEIQTSSLPKRLYTHQEVIGLFNISRGTLITWCKDGVLEKVSIPGKRRVYVTAESIDKLIKGKAA